MNYSFWFEPHFNELFQHYTKIPKIIDNSNKNTKKEIETSYFVFDFSTETILFEPFNNSWAKIFL